MGHLSPVHVNSLVASVVGGEVTATTDGEEVGRPLFSVGEGVLIISIGEDVERISADGTNVSKDATNGAEEESEGARVGSGDASLEMGLGLDMTETG